jgi:hypothetical protein
MIETVMNKKIEIIRLLAVCFCGHQNPLKFYYTAMVNLRLKNLAGTASL